MPAWHPTPPSRLNHYRRHNPCTFSAGHRRRTALLRADRRARRGHIRHSLARAGVLQRRRARLEDREMGGSVAWSKQIVSLLRQLAGRAAIRHLVRVVAGSHMHPLCLFLAVRRRTAQG